jgi:hypothetical protein
MSWEEHPARRQRKPLWLAQLHNWLYWHPAPRGHVALCVERSLMSPALRRYLPDDPLYCMPSPFEQLHDV